MKSVFRLVVAATAAFLAPAHADAVRLDLPPRLQWNANSGYCGETSFISAGLALGQYCSQFEARRIASPGVPQSRASSQLLLGENDRGAARAMRLQAEGWRAGRQNSTREFLAWMTQHVLDGHTVIIGVFNNEFRLYDKTDPAAGDPSYDHIVPVVAIQSRSQLGGAAPRYRPTDQVTFSDNGLWNPSGTPRYFFRYGFGSFPKNRAQANARGGPVYALNNDKRNYGIAITGVIDHDGHTVPVRLATNVNFERPAMKNGSDRPPPAGPLELTATVTLPDPGATYVLYRYDDFAKVPVGQFNANAANAAQSWRIPPESGPEFTVKLAVRTDDVVVFRAVPTSAP